MIIDHNSIIYQQAAQQLGKKGKYNGAFYYSKEIVKNIIPNVQTDRNWVTIRAGEDCMNHAIVFIHNNLHPERYNFLERYKDLILVCGIPETCEKVSHLGKAIYLPLSVDVEYVKQFALPQEEREGTCYVGRKSKTKYEGIELPKNIDYLHGMKRQNMLPELAKYKFAYAVGRSAIEAKILGLEILPYDPRYPDTSRWKIFDNKDAAKLLQQKLNEIDGRGKHH